MVNNPAIRGANTSTDGHFIPSIAYFNLLKWRTSTSNNLSELYDISWREHTSEQFRLLRPNVVIAVGVDAGKAFLRHCADSPHFDVIPRVIGNNIGEPGKEAIRRICVWLLEHPVSRFAASMDEVLMEIGNPQVKGT